MESEEGPGGSEGGIGRSVGRKMDQEGNLDRMKDGIGQLRQAGKPDKAEGRHEHRIGRMRRHHADSMAIAYNTWQ